MKIRKTRALARLSAVAAVAACVALPATAFAHFGDHTLATGSHGHDVRVLQSWLDKLGFDTSVDGQFGRHTRWALRRFEQSKGLQINGVLSQADAQVLRQAMDAQGSGTAGDDTTTALGPGDRATMSSDGLHAVAPASAPAPVQQAIAAANRIVGKPYKYGGGHGQWEDSGYDCSGTVSYALHGGGLLSRPMASGDLEGWGASGSGQWITVYANGGHAYAVIAGLRLDTSGSGGKGPRWHTDMRSSSGYTVRHWRGL